MMQNYLVVHKVVILLNVKEARKGWREDQATTPNDPKRLTQENHSIVNTFTIEEIETHMESLSKNQPIPQAQLKQLCIGILKVIMNHKDSWVFNTPVDPVELNLKDYFEVIRKPMDLGTIKKRVENGCFYEMETFRDDCLLTFDNAISYNAEGSPVTSMAKEIKKNGEACALCGCARNASTS